MRVIERMHHKYLDNIRRDIRPWHIVPAVRAVCPPPGSSREIPSAVLTPPAAESVGIILPDALTRANPQILLLGMIEPHLRSIR